MSLRKLLLVVALLGLAACDSGDKPQSAAPALTAGEQVALAARNAGRALKVADVSEVQVDGASALSVSFAVPLDPQQSFASFLHLTKKNGERVDGAWELDRSLSELRLRHLPPATELLLTIDKGLRAINGATLEQSYTTGLETTDMQASVGFSSRGSLLPTRLAEGLPVIALNVDKVDVDFFRIREERLTEFLQSWSQGEGMSTWQADELLPLAELVYSGRFDLKPPRNTRETLVLPTRDIRPLQQPGVYFAVLRQAGRYPDSYSATLFTLSDIGLSAHRFASRLELFTQSLRDGKSLDKVELRLLDDKGREQAHATSDRNGHATLALTGRERLLLATQRGMTSLLPLNEAALDLGEFDISGPKASALQLFVFGPRDLYRPGETVALNALLRDGDGRPVRAQPVAVEVMRPDGQSASKFTWNADDSGLYQYNLPVAMDAPTGRWQLRLQLGNGQRQTYEFLVEDFLPERMALEITGSDLPLAMADAAEFSINGRYLYGAPASGNTLSGQLYVRALREAVPSLPGFQFGDVNESESIRQEQELEAQTLDASGQASVQIESSWADYHSPLQLVLQASLQESGGRPVTRRAEQAVWPAQQLPGVRAVFDGSEVGSNGVADFELVVANPEGQRLAAEDLTLRLVRERRDYYWSFSGSGWDYHYNQKDLIVSEQPVTTPADGVTRVSFPVEWGPYRVELVDNSTGVRSSLRFSAGYGWQDNTEGGAVRPDQVRLAIDKPAYREGEVAKVTVTPPAAGRGYLMVESAEGPLWWQEIEVPAEGKTFEVPVAGDWRRHDLYLSALVIRPGDREQHLTPRRAVGLLHLPLERAERRLQLELQAAAKARPNQPLQVKVRARNADGSIPASAHVLVSAVDSGILNVTDYATPDPFKGFFGRRGYGVDQLDVYGRLIETGQARKAKLAYGGDAGLDAGGKLPDSKVLILAEQSAPLALDANGEAVVSLDIPDFNGEVRLMAQAWGAERYGVAEAKSVIAAPLVVELAQPRFLGGGDETTLALDLSNRSGLPQQVKVQVGLDGPLQLLQEVPASHELAVDQRITLRIPLRATADTGRGLVRVQVDGLQLPGEDSSPLQREWVLGVRPVWPAQQQRLRLVLDSDAPWKLPDGVLAGLQSSSLQGRLTLSNRPPLDLGEQIHELKAYPYGCLEQTTSGLFPSLYADSVTLRRLGIDGESDAERRSKLALGIGRLLGMQLPSGGFGLWSSQSSEEYWLTVYATDFLLRAREQGLEVPEEPLRKATQRLLGYLQQSSLVTDDAYGEDQGFSRFSVRAYAGYVLARSQQAPLGVLRSLFEQRRLVTRSGLPLVHLAAALQLMGDSQRAGEALQAGLKLERDRRTWWYWYGDYGSPVRDQALILAVLQEHSLASDQVAPRMQVLADELKGRHGLSTQERNALFLAGRFLLQQPEEGWQAELSGSGVQQNLDGEHSSLRLGAAQLPADLSLVRKAGGTLYGQLLLSGYPLQRPTAQGEHLQISREYLDLQGKPVDVSYLNSGQLLLVHLQVRGDSRVSDALVVDLLPAGLELENQNLAQASASLEDASEELTSWLQSAEGSLRHQEFRADRYVAAVDLDGYGTTHLLYLARAVTPGSYRVPPPQVESMYRPEWRAQGDTLERMVITP